MTARAREEGERVSERVRERVSRSRRDMASEWVGVYG
jgi:hypothetical protein